MLIQLLFIASPHIRLLCLLFWQKDYNLQISLQIEPSSMHTKSKIKNNQQEIKANSNSKTWSKQKLKQNIQLV